MVMQLPMFLEDIYDALKDVVRHLGGAKKVGPMLWPGKEPEAAASYLNDCLNPARRETLDPSEMLTLMKWGREIGCHSAMYYISDSVGYERPHPVQPQDQAAELMRAYIESVKYAKQLADRMEALQPSLRAVR